MKTSSKTMIKQKLRNTGFKSVSNYISDIVNWYFSQVYTRWEGPGVIPYYCDPVQVGYFASEPSAIARGDEGSLFKLFVTMAMYQARRNTVIMAQQRAMDTKIVDMFTSLRRLQRLQGQSKCQCLRKMEFFDRDCSVQKRLGVVTCGHHPLWSCHIKETSKIMLRMGDMGKFPTSAWFHCWKDGQFKKEYNRILNEEINPRLRAVMLVKYFSKAHRVGQKLATMFVSALSVPALAPGLTPWFPAVDGSDLVVVDTNVAQVVDLLRKGLGAQTYEARSNWVRKQARRIDLHKYSSSYLPQYSPRIIQQAIYHFRSKSNRVAMGNLCSGSKMCRRCLKTLCPMS